MKMYRKKLSSIEELQREKIRLRYERKSTKAKHLLPDIGKAKKKLLGGKKSTGAKGDMLSMAMGMLSGKSTLSTVLSLAGPLLKMIFNKRGTSSNQFVPLPSGPSKPSFVSRLLKDIVVAYLIGKTLQLTIGLGKGYLQSRKKAQQAKAQFERAGVTS